MHIPKLVERVIVDGHDEIYLVTRVDLNCETAHVVPLEKAGATVLTVPFSSLSPAGPPPGWSRPD